jgi:short-subunit dehydrogenase
MIGERDFPARYGPWGLVIGGSKGIGRAFATRLATMGMNLVLTARDRGELDEIAGELRADHGVEVRVVSVDLDREDAVGEVRAAASDLEVGLMIYNAAFYEIRDFFDSDLDSHLRTLNVNCRGPLTFAHEFGRQMLERRRGGMLFMSSMSGWQGSAMLATYSASKAFDTVLGEGLWEELRHHGVDVLSFVAGATKTPSFLSMTPPEKQAQAFPRLPDQVAEEALSALGRHPMQIAGPINKLAAFITQRFLPRRTAIRFMSNTNRRIYGG